MRKLLLILICLPVFGFGQQTINDSIIQLCETYINSTLNPPTVVSIGDTGGGSQTISPINPRIKIVKDNSLVFDLSDSTLNGYLLKIYYDNQFNNEFV